MLPGTQLPAAPPAGPQTPPAAQTPAPKPRPSAQRSTAARLTLTVQITDNVGKVLGDADVIAVGPVDRQGTTDEEGSITFRNMAAGTYRLRFQHEGSITLEGRALTLAPGSRVIGTVSAAAVMVSGTVEGSIDAAERLEINNTAVVEGDVSTPRLVVADGAQLKAVVDMPMRSNRPALVGVA